MKFTGRLSVLLVIALLSACAATGPDVEVAQPAKDMPKVDPKITAAYENALTDMRAGKTAQAEKALLQLAQQHPNYSGPQTNLGILYFQKMYLLCNLLSKAL